MMHIFTMNPNQYVKSRNKFQASACQGFTLIEMMVVVIVAGILLSIALPSFEGALLSSKLRSYANNLVASVHLARGEAIKRNAVVTLCVSSDGINCTAGGWELGWIVVTNDGVVVQRQQAVANGYKITEATALTNLSFQPTGVGATQASMTICRSTPYAGEQERLVSVSATGRPSVVRTTNGVCA